MRCKSGATFGTVLLALFRSGLRLETATDKCIEWPGTRTRQGYGVFTLNGKQVRAHRVVWEMAYGGIPEGLVLLHTCDNPPCVNPRHLRPGSPAENVVDCQQKGRRVQVNGEQHGMAKLTGEQVAEIRRRYIPRVVTLAALGREYGISESAVHLIVRGKKWAS